jgi:Flp pilus assembly protein TadB
VKYQQKYLSVLLAILLVTSTAFGWTQALRRQPTRALSTTEQQLVDSISVAVSKKRSTRSLQTKCKVAARRNRAATRPLHTSPIASRNSD